MRWITCSLFLAILTPARADERPNVVIFFADDLGTLAANCYGSKDLYTPNIETSARSH